MRLKILMLAAVLGLASAARADFIVGNTSLPGNKTNLFPVPPSADPNKFFQASDYNALMQALLDSRTAIVAGSYKGFTIQTSDPLPINSTNYMWLQNTGQFHLVLNGVTDTKIAYGIVTTKGDLLPYNGSNFVRFAAGSDGQCLTAQSGQASGLLWAACGSTNGLAAAYAAGSPASQNTILLATSTGSVLIRDNATPFAAGTALFGIQNSAGSSHFFEVSNTGIGIGTTPPGTLGLNVPYVTINGPGGSANQIDLMVTDNNTGVGTQLVFEDRNGSANQKRFGIEILTGSLFLDRVNDNGTWQAGDLVRYQSGTMGSDFAWTFAPAASTSGTPAAIVKTTGPASTGLANAEANDVDLALNRTVTFSGGGAAITNQRAAVVRAPTYAASAAQTISNAATFAITGAPVAGTNVTLTQSFALWVQGGNTNIAGTLFVNAQTNSQTILPLTDNTYSLGTTTGPLRWSEVDTLALKSGASQLTTTSGIANGATPAMLWNTSNTFSSNIAYQWNNNGTYLWGIYPAGTITYFGFNSAVTQYFAWDSTNSRIQFAATNGFVPALDNTYAIGTTSLRLTEVDSLAFKSGASSLTLLSGVADGASAVAHIIDSTNQINASGSGGKLVSFRSNAGTEVAAIKPFFGSANNQGIQMLGETSNTFLQLSNANGSKVAYGAYYMGMQVVITGFNFHFGTGEVVEIDSGAIFPGTDATLTSLGKKANRYNGVFNAGADSCNYNAQSGTTYTTVAGDCQVVISNAAAKTVTLAASTTYPAGGRILVVDGGNNAGTQNISVAKSASDTINGGAGPTAVVTVNSAHSTCVTDGVSKWVCGINN